MTWWPLIKILPQKTNFHFVKYARPAAFLSVVLCVASIVACFYPGLNMGIDFRGGASMGVAKPAGEVIALDDLRATVGEIGLGDVLALASAVVLMFAYIWFRFEPQFGFGAVAGLLHDVVLTFGLIVLFKLEFSLNMVAAILTVIGYSMNDTVVVFDRLRENLRKYKTMPLGEVIDLSLNETLSRTIITGVTAVMVLAALAVFGGEALFGFSIALMFGIIVGTYSSIYVGAPIILLWGVKRGEIAEEAKPVKLGMASRP